MSLIANQQRRGGGGQGKGGSRRQENNRIYAHPIPLVFSPPQTKKYSLNTALGIFGVSLTTLENPHCEGVLDRATRSVWVSNPRDTMILWRRGFFGKGDLSRSEPSWHTRQLHARQAAGKYLTSEEIREKRRAERKQFKLDRARAMEEAARVAEVAFAEGREAPVVAIPSGATWKPHSQSTEDEQITPRHDTEEDILAEEEPLEDMEHLQLTLQEAFFLMWNFDCLAVLDSASHEPLTLKTIWLEFQRAYHPPGIPIGLIAEYEHRFDNPFLINYVAYHYYRALGWIVKGGLKFCVDLLLYKRGPVFQHAEFAIVVLPVYEDPEDQKSSPFDLHNSSPFSWSWLSTINRVNSQVQKTLILTYITIPARSRVDSTVISSPACLAHYTIREVVLRRFIPARMRD